MDGERHLSSPMAQLIMNFSAARTCQTADMAISSCGFYFLDLFLHPRMLFNVKGVGFFPHDLFLLLDQEARAAWLPPICCVAAECLAPIVFYLFVFFSLQLVWET